jgi:hypothetical protein
LIVIEAVFMQPRLQTWRWDLAFAGTCT